MALPSRQPASQMDGADTLLYRLIGAV